MHNWSDFSMSLLSCQLQSNPWVVERSVMYVNKVHQYISILGKWIYPHYHKSHMSHIWGAWLKPPMPTHSLVHHGSPRLCLYHIDHGAKSYVVVKTAIYYVKWFSCLIMQPKRFTQWKSSQSLPSALLSNRRDRHSSVMCNHCMQYCSSSISTARTHCTVLQ